MRAVLVGYDLMYDGTGRLVPIEMNTNVGYDAYNRAELEKDWQKPEALLQFIESEGIKKVYLDNKNGIFWHKGSYILEKLVEVLGEENVIKYREGQDNPEDTEDNLIIRVDFSYDAQVDSYCRDKIAFLNLIKDDEAIGQEFMYKENGEVKGSLSFQDNGDYPNYVVKYRYPNYSSEYPKFYKFDSIEEVNALAESLEDDFLIMKAYFNNYSFWAEKGRFKELRSWDVITSTGETIKLGVYTKVTGKISVEKDTYTDDKQLSIGSRNYRTAGWYIPARGLVYLDSDDQVLMSDGTWKDARQVNVGDEVMSLNLPSEGNVDISQHVGDYNIEESTLRNNSTITGNEVKQVRKSHTFVGVVHLLFEEDEEEWWDLAQASYPVEDPEDGTVMFKEIQDFKVGDKVYLLSSSIPNEISYIKRTVSDVWVERNLLEGNSITVDGSHLLITRSPESTANYVAIMHNDPTTDNDNSGTGGNQTGSGDIDNPNGSQEHDELDNPVGGGGGHSGNGSGSGTGTGSGTETGGDSGTTPKNGSTVECPDDDYCCSGSAGSMTKNCYPLYGSDIQSNPWRWAGENALDNMQQALHNRLPEDICGQEGSPYYCSTEYVNTGATGSGESLNDRFRDTVDNPVTTTHEQWTSDIGCWTVAYLEDWTLISDHTKYMLVPCCASTCSQAHWDN